MSVYIYSTLSQDTAYTSYKPLLNDRDISQVESKILIKGGAGVINKNLVTPMGTVTKVTDEEYAMLEENQVFQMHVQNGFIVAERAKANINKVAKDMESRDRGSQLIPSDLKKEGMPKVLENRI